MATLLIGRESYFWAKGSARESDPTKGSPLEPESAVEGILEGLAPDGEPVLVKTWPRNPKQNDDDLAEMWYTNLDNFIGCTATGCYRSDCPVASNGLGRSRFLSCP